MMSMSTKRLPVSRQSPSASVINCCRHVGLRSHARGRKHPHSAVSSRQKRISMSKEHKIAVCCGAASQAEHNLGRSTDDKRQQLSYTNSQNPVTRLWAGLLLLCACTLRYETISILYILRYLHFTTTLAHEHAVCCCRCQIKLQTSLFLLTQALYVFLHLKPLTPLLLRKSGADELFLRHFTTGAYFASELFLFWLLAFASPMRCASHLVLC